MKISGSMEWQLLTTNDIEVRYRKQVKPRRNKMISSNNNKYVLKCYLNVFTIVLTEIGSVKVSLSKVND